MGGQHRKKRRCITAVVEINMRLECCNQPASRRAGVSERYTGLLRPVWLRRRRCLMPRGGLRRRSGSKGNKGALVQKIQT